MHGGRSAYQHLAGFAAGNGIPRRRVEEVPQLVGLPVATARKRTEGFSLGTSRRLGIAAALIGDPEVLIPDEPVSGLGTEGIRWVRDLMKSLAARGRTAQKRDARAGSHASRRRKGSAVTATLAVTGTKAGAGKSSAVVPIGSR
ncbi:ATP-binding cassette domain-containing protein [Streptomyces lunaelactis]|uniref:ATP-binding cassette domain-containing protein n=1 Tax=Streptomyces lunaelactis TaxID=1535768 RepID=UPI0035A1C629